MESIRMSKAVKIFVGALVGLIVLAAIGMVLVVLFVNPNDYKDDISKVVRDKTGRKLVFEGDLHLSLFPWVGVRTGGVSLSNAPGFPEENMLSLRSADVSVELLPLLSGNINISDIDVKGLAVNLMRSKSGATNWESLT